MRVRRTPMLPSLPLGPRPPRGDDRVKGPVSSTRLATRKRAARSGYRATPSALRPPRSGLVQQDLDRSYRAFTLTAFAHVAAISTSDPTSQLPGLISAAVT